MTEKEYKQFQGTIRKETAKIELMEDLVGQNVFFRCVTYHILGTVKQVIGNFVELENASWIGNSGTYSEFLEGSDPLENEVITGREFVNLDTVVDFVVGRDIVDRTI